MTAATSHIDLGELPHGEQPGDQPAWPGWRALTGRRSRWVLVVAVAALTLSTVTAAPVRPPFQLRFALQTAQFAVDSAHLYTLDKTGPGSVLTAHRLDDGGVAWRASLPADPAEIGVTSYATGAPLLVYYRHDPTTDSVSGVDSATGEIRWTAEGSVVAATEQLLLLQRPSVPDAQPATDLAHSDLEVDYLGVDVHTGESRWHIEHGSADWRVTYPDRTRAVMLTRTGELRSYDLGTGRLLATASTGSARGGRPELLLAGDTVLLEEARGDGPRRLRAYDLADLRHRWTAREPARGELGGYTARCGELLCRVDSGQVRAIRPDTGALAWSVDDLPDDQPHLWVGNGPLPGHLVVSQPTVHSGDQRSHGRQWLLDSDTGETVLDLAGWRLLSNLTDEPDLDVWVMEADAAAPAWVGRLRPDLSGIEPIGQLGPAEDCWIMVSSLVCHRSLDDRSLTEIAVWQFQR